MPPPFQVFHLIFTRILFSICFFHPFSSMMRTIFLRWIFFFIATKNTMLIEIRKKKLGRYSITLWHKSWNATLRKKKWKRLELLIAIGNWNDSVQIFQEFSFLFFFWITARSTMPRAINSWMVLQLLIWLYKTYWHWFEHDYFVTSSAPTVLCCCSSQQANIFKIANRKRKHEFQIIHFFFLLCSCFILCVPYTSEAHQWTTYGRYMCVYVYTFATTDSSNSSDRIALDYLVQHSLQILWRINCMKMYRNTSVFWWIFFFSHVWYNFNFRFANFR